MPHPPVVPPLPADQIYHTAVSLTQHVIDSKHPIGGQGWHQFTTKQRKISLTLFATKERRTYMCQSNISCNQHNLKLRSDQRNSFKTCFCLFNVSVWYIVCGKKYIPNQANNFIQLLRSSRNQLKTKFNMQLNVNKMYKQFSIFNKNTHHSNFISFSKLQEQE